MAVALGIVGHAAEKFTADTKRAALEAIDNAIVLFEPDVIVSGRSPMGGIDVWAEELADFHSLEPLIFPPAVRSWSGPGGFKERNLQIASASDLVLCIVVANLPPGYDGMRFPGCYHCEGRNPAHVKSGGCWTAWRCERQAWMILG